MTKKSYENRTTLFKIGATVFSLSVHAAFPTIIAHIWMDGYTPLRWLKTEAVLAALGFLVALIEYKNQED